MDKKIHNSQGLVLCKNQKDHKILLTKAANLACKFRVTSPLYVQRNAIQGTMQKYSKMIQKKMSNLEKKAFINTSKSTVYIKL